MSSQTNLPEKYLQSNKTNIYDLYTILIREIINTWWAIKNSRCYKRPDETCIILNIYHIFYF